MEKYRFTNEQQTILEKMKIPFGVYQSVDDRVTAVLISDGFCELFGFSNRDDAYYYVENDINKYTHPDDVNRLNEAVSRFVSEGGKYEIIYRTQTADCSEYMIVHAMGQTIYIEDGVRLAYIWFTDEGTYTDEFSASETKLNNALNEALHRESIINSYKYDSLTGLPKMNYFFELAEEKKDEIESSGGNVAALFINLRGMKFFNSTYGFVEGDNLLKAVSTELTNIFGDKCCCRIGGDHFAVSTEEDNLEERIQTLFERCQNINDGNTLPICVGIYLRRIEPVYISSAIDRAKFACDDLRNVYGSGYNYFSKAMRDRENYRQYIISNLDRALEKEWIQVYFQPIVRAINGRVCDEEALARWLDPVMGIISPADFIPYLEEARIIYKLDLYILERVIKKIKYMKSYGFSIVPQSINLSRSDFECCDMVEEIRKRVDEAGVSRNHITIEITESIIGKNFEYMKGQIDRFQKLGFPVWMDDFGSGYSSLDVMQEIPFDLIKFDLSFMQRLDKGPKGKIILTNLMKMATELGVDTVCEGVETEEQVHFLQEIGCSKLQGYYFLKPVPLEHIMERYAQGIQIGFENPSESGYFDDMGRINLYDLSAIANKNEDGFYNTFDTIPMGIIEYNPDKDTARFARSNTSFRRFMQNSSGIDLIKDIKEYPVPSEGPGSDIMNKVKQCLDDGSTLLVEETLPGEKEVHLFARRVGVNSVTGNVAIAIAVLSIVDKKEK